MHVIKFASLWKVRVASVIVGLASLVRSITATAICLLGVVEHLRIVEVVVLIIVISVTISHRVSAAVIRLHLSRVASTCTWWPTRSQIWIIIIENSILQRIISSSLIECSRTVVNIRIITLTLIGIVASLIICVQLTSVLLNSTP
jgi:hypothetical protein